MLSFSESDVSDTDSEEERRRSTAANVSGQGANGHNLGPGQKDLDWYYDQEVLSGQQLHNTHHSCSDSLT